MTIPVPLPIDSILLIGPTGVGKSPLGDLIALRGFHGRRAHHLDFGSELRSIAKSSGLSSYFTSTELGFIRAVLEQGLLLENQHFPLARKIFSHFLERTGFQSRDVLILNGIPRHRGQAQDIAALANIHALVVLDCTADTIYCRLQDNIAGDRTERSDDGKDLVQKKLKIFIERTTPLIEHYKKSRCIVYHIPVIATATTDDTYSLLCSLSSADPPIALIAEPPQR